MRSPILALLGFAVCSFWQTPLASQEQSLLLSQDSLSGRAELQGEEAGSNRSQPGYFAASFLSAVTVGFFAPNMAVENAGEWAVSAIPGLVGLGVTAAMVYSPDETVPPDIQARIDSLPPQYREAFRRGFQRGVFTQRRKMFRLGGWTGVSVGVLALLVFVAGGGGS